MNIILVVWDATRAQNLSCYGHRCKTTPNLDRLLEEDDNAVIYDQAISASVWTLSAMASLFTGTYVSRHRTHWGNISLDPKLPTLPERLRQKGYNTIGLTPNRAWTSWHCGFDRGFGGFYETRGGILEHKKSGRLVHALNKVLPKACHELRFPELATWKTTSTARKTLKAYGGRKEPFFLYLHYVEAHLKYVPPFSHRKFIRWSKDFLRQFTVNMNAVAYLAGAVQMREDDFRLLEGLYDSAIHYQDYSLGILFKYVKQCGLWDDTLIIVTADHGENIGDHNLMEHRYCLYDTLTHVPLIIKYPASFKPSQKRVASLVQPHDIVPTLLELIDSKSQGRVTEFPDAYSLISSVGERRYAVSEYPHPQITQNIPQKFDLSRYNRGLRSIRTERMKYIWSSDNNDEFYDLQKDVKESVNLIADPSSRMDVDKLKTIYREWSSQFDHQKEDVIGQDRRIDEDVEIHTARGIGN